jgi:hypothetical protein
VGKEPRFRLAHTEVAHQLDSAASRPAFLRAGVLFRVLFLETWANLSDAQVCGEVG